MEVLEQEAMRSKVTPAVLPLNALTQQMTCALLRQCARVAQKAHDNAASVLVKEVSDLKDKLAEGQQQHADALRKARDAAEQDKQRFVERTDRVLLNSPTPMLGHRLTAYTRRGLHAMICFCCRRCSSCARSMR